MNWQATGARWLSFLIVPLMLAGPLGGPHRAEDVLTGETDTSDSEIFGIVGLDPWRTYNADPVNHPDDVNRTLLERMVSDMARLGARWVRIEFNAEKNTPQGPGPIDYAKYDWFINELAPAYGIKVLAVLGSGLIGDLDPAWNFRHINDQLDENGTNRYIDAYVGRVGEITARYGNRLGAVEILNEPNASEILSLNTSGIEKTIKPGNYGELLRRSYETVQETSPLTDVVLGGMLYDTNNNTLPEEKDRSYDLDWLEQVYASRPVMSYRAEHHRFPFDAVAVHPYFLQPDEIIDYLFRVRDVQAKFGGNPAPVWITEVGWPAEPPALSNEVDVAEPTASEREQASFLSAVFTTVQQKAPFVERIFWFKYEDFPMGNQLESWGLVRLRNTQTNYGGYSNPWPRKFAYAVYQALARPDQIPIAPVPPPATASPDATYFPETGHTIHEPFLSYWLENGGEQLFGLPITEAFEHKGRLIQYFEYTRLEHYPELAGEEGEIQIGRLGSFLVAGRQFESFPPRMGPDDGRLYFFETGQYVLGAFRLFYEKHGGLERFGIPLSPEIEENGVLVQYFERARFEFAPKPDGSGHEVRLGKIGVEVLEGHGWYR